MTLHYGPGTIRVRQCGGGKGGGECNWLTHLRPQLLMILEHAGLKKRGEKEVRKFQAWFGVCSEDSGDPMTDRYSKR